ncbi:choline transporter-like 1 isoform X2 [Anabrus simplex]|uniref:choline transporter-like 1 isoform X2 n=1 Tax=Anabrus simplex TaxID=316456 RepID=UPI0034DD1F0D
MSCCDDDSSSQNNPSKSRGCTDVIWLCAFTLFLFLMIFVAAFAIVYGNPLRLINGYDSFGNTCGTAHNDKVGNLTLSGLDMSDKQYLFYLNVKDIQNSLKICVKKCPHETLSSMDDIKKFYYQTGSSLCRYDFNFKKFEQDNWGPDKVNDAVTVPLGPCPPVPVFASEPVLNRCIPRPVKDVAAQIVTSLYAMLNSWDAVEQVLADLYAAWKEILALSFLAFVLSLIMIAILHLVASVVAWIIMLIVTIAAVGGTGFLWYTYINIYKKHNATPENQLLEESVRNERAFLVYSIAASIITVIILLLVIAMRKRIRFMAQLFEDSASCLGSIPALFLQPLITFLALLAFFAFWIAVIVCLATSNYPGVKPLHPFLDVGLQSPGGLTTPARLNTSRVNISLQSFKKFTMVEFVDPAWVRYFWWVYLIGLVWVSEFILACQQMVIAGAVSQWYFNGLKGSAEGNACARCGLKCCICCFWCFENFIRFMNHNAYTVIAMEGVHFCSAARRAFSTLGGNALRLITLNSVGDFILFLGKCFVTAVTGCIGLLFLKQDPHLHFYAIPTLAVCIFAFFIAHCVLSLYEIVIDTMFLCVCEDERLNPEGGVWQQTGVMNARRSEAEATELAPINV